MPLQQKIADPKTGSPTLHLWCQRVSQWS